MPEEKKTYWLDKKRNVNIIIGGLVLICIVLAALDFTYHKHVHFDFEEGLAFFAWYGFVVCVGLVLAARLMRIFLKRDEGYYDE